MNRQPCLVKCMPRSKGLETLPTTKPLRMVSGVRSGVQRRPRKPSECWVRSADGVRHTSRELADEWEAAVSVLQSRST